VKNSECAELLQWLLPILRLRWPGFRRVRKQVCKRFARRLKALGLERADEYRQYLLDHPQEWAIADSLCTITISRFYRDVGVFAYIGSNLLPRLGARALEEGRRELIAWSAGCGSGEEPYTLALIWQFRFRRSGRLPGLELKILGTDIADELLRRARNATYPPGCLKDLPKRWRIAAFDKTESGYCLKPAYGKCVEFQRHDIREPPIDGPFDLVLCRNLAFTYFDHGLQLQTAQRLHAALADGGALILGLHEALPADVTGFSAWSTAHRVYRKLGI
jgi:chemotaxis protein methyltransferase CheR